MMTYVVLATFTDQGVKNAKDSPKRAEAFRQMAKTFGVAVKDIFWTQGRYDIVTVVEAPDELSATALNLSLGALGNIRTESLRAFSSEDDEDRRQDALVLSHSNLSVIGGKADIDRKCRNVRFWPLADIAWCTA
jgi:uncharacterized protein with GYD domain